MSDQTDIVYVAQQAAELDYGYDETLDNLTPDELLPFTERVLRGAGWYEGMLPEFRLDSPDEYDGVYHQGVDGEYIRLHPERLNVWTVVHELAHWCVRQPNHGPEFCGVLVALAHAGISPEAADCLYEMFRHHGVLVDEVSMAIG